MGVKRTQPKELPARLKRLLDRACAFRDSRRPWDRSLWYTRGWRRTKADEPAIVRRARALQFALLHTPIHIHPDERIVGEVFRTSSNAINVAPEFRWMNGVVAPEQWVSCEDARIPGRVRRELSWWRGRNHGALSYPFETDPATVKLRAAGVFEGPKTYWGHKKLSCPQFSPVLPLAFPGPSRTDRRAGWRAPTARNSWRNDHSSATVSPSGNAGGAWRSRRSALRLSSTSIIPRLRSE
jgi:hypothetical protein